MYDLEYLPLAMRDMVDIVKYISHDLHSPVAADNLASEMVNTAERLRMFPYSNPVHRTVKPVKREYRKLMVKHYIMFYYVDEMDKKIVITRVVYARRDYESFL